MAGHYRRKKNNTWQLCVHIGYDLNGKRIRKYKDVEATGKREVERLLSDFVQECKKYTYSKFSTTKFKDFFYVWLKEYAENGLRKKTVSRYKTLWPRIEKCLGHFELPDIRPTHLIQFYNILKEDGIRLDGKPGGLSMATIKHHHTLISTVLETAVTWELISSNPCSKVKLARIGISDKDNKKRTEESVYTINQTIELLEKIKQSELKYQVFINLAIFTGCRREELLGLEWSDINFSTGEINIVRSSQYTPHDGIFEDELKNFKSRRNCFVPEEIIDLLNKYKVWWDLQREKSVKKDKWNETNKLFIKHNGLVMHPDTPTKWFNKFLKKYDLPHTSIHKLRHLHSSILYSMGMNMSELADQLGHSDTQMLIKRYLHNITKNSTKASKLMSKALTKKENVNLGDFLDASNEIDKKDNN